MFFDLIYLCLRINVIISAKFENRRRKIVRFHWHLSPIYTRINYRFNSFQTLMFLFTIYLKTMMPCINNSKQTYLNFKSNFPLRPCFSFVYSSPSRPSLIVFTSFKSAARGLPIPNSTMGPTKEGERRFAIVVF